MLSERRLQAVEREAAREMERYHRDVRPTTLASIVDDIRHKVVEEGWFGRQVTENIADVRKSYDESLESGADVSLSHELSEQRPVQPFYDGPVQGWTSQGADGKMIEAQPTPLQIEQQKPPKASL